MKKALVLFGIIFSLVLVALPLHAEVGMVLPSLRGLNPVSVKAEAISEIAQPVPSLSWDCFARWRSLAMTGEGSPRNDMAIPDPIDTSASFEWCG